MGLAWFEHATLVIPTGSLCCISVDKRVLLWLWFTVTVNEAEGEEEENPCGWCWPKPISMTQKETNNSSSNRLIIKTQGKQ